MALPPHPPQASRVIARSPVYYGWVILAAATVGLIMTTPGQTVGVSVFLDKIIDDLGLSRSTVSLLYTVGTLTGSLALPFVGRFIDRHGPRLAVAVIAALFALACVWMGFVGGLVTLAIGFVLIRGLGQGSLSLVSMHVVNIWFVRRRGLAVGLAGLGFALSTAVFPLLIEALIGRFEWRVAYMLLGVLVAVTILPLGVWLYRGHPERFGLLPDSRLPPAADQAEANLSLAEARRTGAFWLFAGGSVCIAALSTGLVFHHYSIMAASGIDRLDAAGIFVVLGVVTALANVSTGVLMDRVQPRFLLAGMLAFLASALVLSSTVASTTMVLYGALLGCAMGMNGAIGASVYAYYFGRGAIGSIKGLATTLTVIGSAFGPLLFALGLEGAGSYSPVLLGSALAPLALGALALARPLRL